VRSIYVDSGNVKVKLTTDAAKQVGLIFYVAHKNISREGLINKVTTIVTFTHLN
jgi:hypothetical protein